MIPTSRSSPALCSAGLTGALSAKTMISVGRRIQEAIDHMGKGETMLALTPACIALDVTSQRHAGLKRSSRSSFKRFVQENLWLIT